MAAMADVDSEDLKKLMKKKEVIENLIKEFHDVLQSKEVGMTGMLVDEEDYPRPDIDIHTVRHTRQRIICLQNDHKNVMKEIEQGLHQLHSTTRQQKEIQGDEAVPRLSILENAPVPFAIIDRVDADSPASEGGVQVGDEVLHFGSVNTDNFSGLAAIGEIVLHANGKSVSIVVFRNGKKINLTVTPKAWSGRGLLGCNIIPIK